MATDEVFEFGYRHGRQVEHFLVDVTAHGHDNLSRVLAVAFSGTVNREMCATHFRIDGTWQLTFFEHPPWSTRTLDAEPFQEPLTFQQALDFVWEWLQQVKYPSDEHDGASKRGWRVFNEQFGIVGKCWEAFVAIRPMWIYIPK